MNLRGSEGEDDSASAREHKFNTIHKDSGMSTSQIDDYDDEDRQDDCWKKSINLGQRLVFKPEGAGYILWTTIIFFCETFLALSWAMFSVYPLPVVGETSYHMRFIFAFEFIVFIDIFSEFFQAYKEEGSDHYVMDFDIIWSRYLQSKEFRVRILTFIPWGVIGEILEKPNIFRLLWLIRAYKIMMSLEILGPKFVSRLLHTQAKKKLEQLLEKEEKMTIEEK